MTRKFPATDITHTVFKHACPITPEDWNIMLGLKIPGRIAFTEAMHDTPAMHDYAVMLYREFGLDYREETSG